MQIRRGSIVNILLAIAFPVLIYALQYTVDAIPNWLIYPIISICGLIVIGSILALTPLWDRLFKKEPVQTLPSEGDSSIPFTNMYSSIVRIKSREPSKYPPVVFETALVICSLILLASGTWIIYLAISSRVILRDFNTSWLMFILLIIVLPLWILVDTFIVERKQRKLGRSRVAKEKTVDLDDEPDAVFEKCRRAIIEEQSSIIALDRLKLIKAQWRKSIVTLTITNMGHGRVRVHILSDSKWITTKWDFGTNQKNVDAFERLLQTKEQGLVRDKPLIFQIGETAYTAPHPYIDEREVSAIICQVIFGNPNNEDKTINTFRLEVNSKAPYLLSEARDSERGGSYLVPSGGGFASVPRKPWLSVPLTVNGKNSANGWIGFCIIERRDLTLKEAWNMAGELVAVQTDGVELRCPFPVCSLPRTDQS